RPGSGTKAAPLSYSAVPNVKLPPPETWTEHDRIAEPRAYGVLRADAEPGFSELVALAARICDVPTAMVGLVDSDIQWFMARVGLDLSETPREYSFCDHAMRQS